MLADAQWKAITVRHMIAADGTRQTFPWEFDPPRASTGCPAADRWDLSIAPRVTGQSPVMVSIELRILPPPPPGMAPDAWHVPPTCGARTTLVLRDQQLIVLSGFPAFAGASAGVVTTVTPYVIWEDRDLERLLECKRKLAQPNRDVVRSVPPQTPAPGAL